MPIKDEADRIYRKIAQDRHKAEWYLLYTDIEQEKYLESRQVYIAGGNDEKKLYNPTERIAVKGLEFDQFSDSYKWLKAVKIIESSMSSKEKLFLTARRKAANEHGRAIGRPGWVIRTQQIYYEGTKNKISGSGWLSEDQVKRWWRRIVNRVADVGVRL